MQYRCSIVALSALLLVACAKAPGPSSDTLHVSATFYPLAFLAERIGGGTVSVSQITPGGVEPHEYEPSPQQIADAHDADVFLMNGAGIDAWAGKVLTDIASGGVATVRMTDEIQAMTGFNEEGEENPLQPSSAGADSWDPHLWLDPVNVRREAEIVRDALGKADPENAAYYAANADALMADIDVLDAEFREGLKDCTLGDIVVSHNAFRYMAQRYGFRTLAISGLSPEEEPSPKRIAEIADLSRKLNVRVIFFETLVSPKLAQTVAEEIGAQALVLNPLEGLTPDEAAEGEEYFTVMRDNLKNLRTAMQCR